MKKNISISICVALFLLFTTACKTKKIITQTTVKAPKLASPLAKIIATQVNFNTFTTKASTALTLNGNSYDASLNIRIKNKETIWISATAFGIMEIGRILITPDSIKILNKVNSQITLKPFNFIHKYINNKIDFATLQAILVGNTMPFMLDPKSQIVTDSSGIILNGVLDNLTFQTKFNSSINLVSALLNNENLGQKFKINYNEFINVAGQYFPLKISLNSTLNTKNISANMQYTTPQLNTILEFPFNIPKRYALID